ncbi:MAG: hypothetical protein HY726_18325 [Candidatus Rokubacteria bacterium]|nr:hypothetical protein [Candidatus Rokubacteria bacterium]
MAGRGFSDRDADRAPGRPWGLIVASVLLAVLAAWTGIQYKRTADREGRLQAEIRQIYQEAEALRSVATQWRDRAMLLQQRVSALTLERDALSRRVGEAEAELAALRGRRGTSPPTRR